MFKLTNPLSSSIREHHQAIQIPAHQSREGYRISWIASAAWVGGVIALSGITAAAVTVSIAYSSLIVAGFAVITAAALGALCMHAAFPYVRPVLPWTAQRTGDILRAQFNEFFACLGLGVLSLCPFKQRDPQEIPIDCKRPILLVHGYMSESSHWTYLRHRLRAADLGPCFTIDLGHPTFDSIDKDYAVKVQEKLEEIRQKTGRSDVILIGHSMGGVISSYYATHLAPKDTVTDIITLGSPLNGTHLAPLGIGECAKQMRVDSELLQDIQRKIPEINTRFLNVASKTDQVILPNNSAILDKPELKPRVKAHAFDRMGHNSYLLNDKVGDLLVDYLRQLD